MAVVLGGVVEKEDWRSVRHCWDSLTQARVRWSRGEVMDLRWAKGELGWVEGWIVMGMVEGCRVWMVSSFLFSPRAGKEVECMYV